MQVHHDQIMGTPGYLAPELLRDQHYSVQSDLYALGVTLYYVPPGAPIARGVPIVKAGRILVMRLLRDGPENGIGYHVTEEEERTV